MQQASKVQVGLRLQKSLQVRITLLEYFGMYLWHGVVTTSAPRIAGKYSFQGKPTALERPILSNSFQPIIGAGGLIPALASNQGREGPLVQFYDKNHNGGQSLIEAQPYFFEESKH